MVAGSLQASPLHDDAYARAVAALFARRPALAIRDLARIRALCAALGDPHRAYDVVHVTGTNGKTSTARIVTALLLAAGRRVGTYTSPHLQDVRERVRLDGDPIDRDRFLTALAGVTRAVPAVESALAQGVTFFETLTALAAHCFAEAKVDTAVVEVGMGGRRDATNVHDAGVAVIGEVGLDHPELGATHAAVAGEKAGIIKDGSIVVMGFQPPAAAAVIEAAARSLARRLLRAGRDFAVAARLAVPGGQDLLLRSGDRTIAAHLPLHGPHQATNAACALAVVDALLASDGGIAPEAARAGLAAVRSPGRLEVLRRDGAPAVVLDGAHNPEGARALVSALEEAFPGRRIVALVAVLADKDVAGVLRTLLERADAAVVTRSPCPRSATPERLAAAARRFGRDVRCATDVQEGLALAQRLAGPDDVVVVTGSLYLVGAARDRLGQAPA